MGWVRCTYRNCTVKSDKKTHMFHYPVFDKTRCHQWLVNAKRLDLLNLTVSQLKNRCVCQHHFEDDQFMNPMKEKLKQYAIPTLDGPHCTPSKEQGEVKEDTQFNISADLIDNDAHTSFFERMANYSTKYGDFLTNCEIMDDQDFLLLSNKNKKPKPVCKTKPNFSERISTDIKRVLNPQICKENKPEKLVEIDLQPQELQQQQQRQQQQQQQQQQNQQQQVAQSLPAKNKMLVKQGQSAKEKQQVRSKVYVKTENLGLIEQKPLSFEECRELGIHELVGQTVLDLPQGAEQTLHELNLPLQMYPTVSTPSNTCMFIQNSSIPTPANQSKIQILSVERILPNVNSDNSASITRIKKKLQLQPLVKETPPVYQVYIENPQSLKLTKEAMDQIQTTDNSKPYEIENTNSLLLQETTPRKRKLAEHEVAKIQEKRKFNMRLGDIIKNSLNQLNTENFEESLQKFKADEASKSKADKKPSNRKSPKAVELPEVSGSHQFVISYLEARMKKMEDLLLNRIDSNTQRINDLKSSLSQNKDCEDEEEDGAVPARGRGRRSDDAFKKNLYKEISQYLTPETNSMIYEELFINKVAESVPRYSKREKSKRMN